MLLRVWSNCASKHRPGATKITTVFKQAAEVYSFDVEGGGGEREGWGEKKGCKVHPCTGTEALYRPYGP